MKVHIEHYTKKLKGKVILDDITTDFLPGRIYGIYGRNGTGKSMLLRAISGLIFPSSGYVEIDGKKITKDIDFPESMGLIIENIRLQPNFDAKTNLRILRDIKKTASDADIDWALRASGLDPDDTSKVRTYSLGMNQKLAIAQAIFEKPRLILLDEPTNALDFQTVKDFRELLIKLKAEDRVIIITSHNKEDLSALADEYCEMIDGRIYARSAEELMRAV